MQATDADKGTDPVMVGVFDVVKVGSNGDSDTDGTDDRLCVPVSGVVLHSTSLCDPIKLRDP
jgi:hypothetical protein